jgi:hypothetical protein
VKFTTTPLLLLAFTVMFAGNVSAGAVVSRTVTLKLPDALLPCASVAEQVTAVVPSGNVLPEAGAHATATLPSTRSDAVGIVQAAAAPDGPVASSVMLEGMPLRLGAVVSCTVTLNEAEALLPCASVAEQFTAVVPSGKLLPDAGEHATVTLPSTRSDAVGMVQLATAPVALLASTIMFAGMPLIAGAVVSCTVTLKEADEELPLASVAEQVTLVVVRAKVEPEAGLHSTATLESTRSEAVGAVQVATAPLAPVASRVMLDGMPLSTGALVSTTVTVNEPVA